MVVLRAFIDHFVLNPQQMQENFQWPPFYSKFSSHDPPPPTCMTSERFLLLLQRFRLTINKYNNAYNYFSNYFSNCRHFCNYLGSVRHRGHKFGSYFFSILCRAARVVEEPAEETQLPVNKCTFGKFQASAKAKRNPKLSLHKIRQNC